MSGTNGRVDLLQADSTVVDRVGYGPRPPQKEPQCRP
jgi:hypothetical protein